jgi:hypothetical protein
MKTSLADKIIQGNCVEFLLLLQVTTSTIFLNNPDDLIILGSIFLYLKNEPMSAIVVVIKLKRQLSFRICLDGMNLGSFFLCVYNRLRILFRLLLHIVSFPSDGTLFLLRNPVGDMRWSLHSRQPVQNYWILNITSRNFVKLGINCKTYLECSEISDTSYDNMGTVHTCERGEHFRHKI